MEPNLILFSDEAWGGTIYRTADTGVHSIRD